jgi:predicted PurR-regulated permease PerM
MTVVAQSPDQTRRARVKRAASVNHVPLATILVTIGLVVAVVLSGDLLYRLRTAVMLLLVAGFVALVLNPQVVALQHWKVRRRGAAVALVTAWGILLFIILAVAFGHPLLSGLTHLATHLPKYVRSQERQRTWLGRLFSRYHVQNWVQRNSPKLVTVAEGLSRPALAVGKGAATALVGVGTVFILVVLFLLEGSKMRTGLLGLLSPERAARYQRLGTEISSSVSGYFLGDLLTSVIAGVVVLITLSILGVPYSLLWALWVALVDFLPTIGGALAGIPTVAFALIHSLTAGVVTAVVFLVYTQIENHVLNPIVMSRTVNVNPLLVTVAIMVGASIGSWVGGVFGAFAAALLAIPFAGAVQVIAKDVWAFTASAEAAVAPTAAVGAAPATDPSTVES